MLVSGEPGIGKSRLLAALSERIASEPHIQRLRRCKPADCVDDGEPGAHRPLGVVFMRLGVAEINQHPVAHVLATKPAKRPTVSATQR